MFDRTARTAAGLLLAAAIALFCFHVSASNPYLAQYSPDPNGLLWFIQTSDTHIGASGSTDSDRLRWLVNDARAIVQPSFIVVTGDLTDSTNGNIFGYPNGPYQAEWDQYKNILATYGVTPDFYFDLPGNHDAYNDADYSYFRANSIQGQTQFSWSRSVPGGEYHFLAVNTADNSGDGFNLFWPYGDYAGLDSTELQFIANDLALHDSSSLTMVFGHHPLEGTGNSQDTYIYYGKDEFVGALNTHSVPLYGCGHVHDYYQSFFVKNMNPGMFYFRVASLAKSSNDQYRIVAIDHDGISSAIQTAGTWPAVLITAPVDRGLGGVVNPFAYTVPNSATNPIRALVFDKNTIASVRFQVDGAGTWYPMNRGDGPVWQGTWNAANLAEGEHTVTVSAVGSTTRSHTIKTYVQGGTAQPKQMLTSPVSTGRYQTNRKTGTTYVSATEFKRGETVIIRTTVTDSDGHGIPNAAVQFAINPTTTGTGAIPVTATSGANGLAEARWSTSAPNKRGIGGTPVDYYRVNVAAVTATGYIWQVSSTAVTIHVY